MAEVKIETTERQIADFREKLGKIIRQVDLIRANNRVIKQTGQNRFDLIKELARNIDEQCKIM
jgi:hypothetical protein